MLLRVDRVIDDDEIAAAPGKCSSYRRSEAPASLGCFKIARGRTLCRSDCPRKLLPVPCRLHDREAVAGMLSCKIVGISHDDKVATRVLTQHPSHPRDRNRDRLQVSRRHCDQQPTGSGSSTAAGFSVGSSEIGPMWRSAVVNPVISSS